jgi:hypothetical protein
VVIDRNRSEQLLFAHGLTGPMLLYWRAFSIEGRRIEIKSDEESIGGHFLHLLHGKRPSAEWVRAMHTSLILYAEHEFNASTFAARVVAGTGSDVYSSITGAIGALRGPKHGGANEVAFEVQSRYANAGEAEVDIRRRIEAKEIVIGFGHPVYTISDPRGGPILRHRRTSRNGDVGLPVRPQPQIPLFATLAAPAPLRPASSRLPSWRMHGNSGSDGLLEIFGRFLQAPPKDRPH